MPDIRIENVTFTYAGATKHALQSINLHIPSGEFVLLAGPSGCGKSTLALALAGLIPSRIAGRLRGEIYLGEKNITRMEIHEIAQHVGMVFQNPDEQLVHLDVESEVAFGPENLNVPRAELERRVEEALLATGMADHRFQEIFALSGGQKQRVAIAATLAMHPSVVVLDEPTSDLDPVGTQEVLQVLRQLNRQHGMTIVLIEHKIDEVIPWVDRVLLMEEGRIVIDESPRKAFEDTQRWYQLGVSVPQTVQLASILPDVFRDQIPLTVEEVVEVLRDTCYTRTLLQHTLMISHQRPHTSGADGARQPILSWENVSVSYDKKHILDNIELAIMPEEWVAIIGPNGAGKTTLASLAMGFQAPNRGFVRHHGRLVIPGQISQQAERMAYLFQAADTMLFAPTVEQELVFGFKHRRNRKEALPFSIDQLLETVDLLAYKSANPFSLSFGQRKRLAIGVLLTRSPDLILLDEPTTGQDEGHARAFLQFLQELRQRKNFTYVMITHDMRSVALYANRVVALSNGRVLLNGTPETVFAQTEQLALCSILPPPVARIHAQLCEGQAERVSLTVEQFVRMVQPIGALSS